MIWAVLALLGIPLWLSAVGILDLVFRDRGRRRRAADIPMLPHLAVKGRWHRGHGLWVQCWASAAAPRPGTRRCCGRPAGPRALTSDEAHKFRRLERPVAATFAAVDGPAFEAVTARQQLPLLLGPFHQSHPHPEARS
jgi:hypothetical protein